jgi:uncharacterized protein YndB with AHSA1/START domain
VAVIKAPLENVFEAHINADRFKQWFARGNDATIHKFDARSGGAWHLTERSAKAWKPWRSSSTNEEPLEHACPS